MSDLTQEACEACQVGAPQLTEAEWLALAPELPEWRKIAVEGVERLHRVFHFPDFVRAMAFAQQVGDLAETHNHHPALLVEWGRVEVSWWTHKVKGVHRNDARLAAKTDVLLS